MTFPYLVVRLTPGVFCRREVRFGQGTATELLDPLWVQGPDPGDTGPLPDTVRHRLVRRCREESRCSDLQLCLVLAADECIYIEPSGSLRTSSEPPAMTPEQAVPGPKRDS